MTHIHWFILVGCLMLTRGLFATTIARLPISSSIVYLCVGLLLGPMALNLFRIDPLAQSHLLEILTEIAVLVSLFSAGVKMPVPITRKRWAPAFRLAFGSMAISVGLVAAFAYGVLGLPIGAAVLLGAVLAPTDPVLATDVQVRHADDRDQLRFNITCEAGMNDGTAFPFVMLGLGLLGLHELGDSWMRWALVDVLWATLSAIVIGAAGGYALGRIGWKLRGKDPKHEVLDDLVGLGLIALVYGVSLQTMSYGFLAVFFAGVALRQTELVLSGAHKDRQGLLVPDHPNTDQGARGPGEKYEGAEAEAPMTISAEALAFKEHIERLSELTLVLLLGGMVSLQNWNWQTISTAVFIFVIVRPLSVIIGLIGSSTTMRVRSFVGWFGVRGIGSIYYLMYAINHGLPKDLAGDLIEITIVVIMLSIVVHGTSVTPLLDHFWKRRGKAKREASG